MGLLEVVISYITFKFGADNFNFIRVRLGQVRLLTWFTHLVGFPISRLQAGKTKERIE